MLSLSRNIQDHIRSFLSFNEIHTTRSVCKEWNDIENVPKNLTHMHAIIPSYASLTRINSFSLYPYSPDSQVLLDRVLQHNRHHLRSLSFESGFRPNHLYFPQLDALEVFRVEDFQSKGTIGAILLKAPNLRELSIRNVDFEVDLSFCPRLEKLSCPSVDAIKNLNHTNISRIDFDRVFDIADIVQFLSIPKLEIKFSIYVQNIDVYGEEGKWYFDLVSTYNSLCVQSVRNIHDMGDDLTLYTEKFRNVVTTIKSIRDTPIAIRPICQNALTKKQFVFEIAFFLSHTGIFKGNEELEMVQQAFNA